MLSKTKQDLLTLVGSIGEVEAMVLLLVGCHLQNYYPLAVEASGEDPKTKMRFGLTVDRSGTREHIKVSVGFSKATSDEAECWIDDPNQTEFPLDDHPPVPVPARAPNTPAFVGALPETAATLALPECAENDEAVDAEIVEEDEQ